MHSKFSIILCLGFLFHACSSPNEEKNKSDSISASSSETLFTSLTTEETGITFNNKIKEDFEVNIINYDYLYNGGGVGVIDVNNDGLMDLYFSGNQVSDELYLNKGSNRFENISKSSGVSNFNGWSTGVHVLDINGDGWEDLYVCRSGPGPEEDRKNILLINQGDQTFRDEAEEYGLDYVGHSTQSLFYDFDKDGDLDMYLMTHPKDFTGQINLKTILDQKQNNTVEHDCYFRNDQGKYIEVSREVGIADMAYGLGVMAMDFNDDGWMDIYVSNDFDEGDLLYINNQNGGFTNEINKRVRHTSNYGMGCDFGDINNDGHQDFMTLDMAFVSHERSKRNMAAMNEEKFNTRVMLGWHYQYMHNMLQLNVGNGTFSEISQMSGVHKSDWSWSVLFGDYDNDGWDDLFVTNGYRRDTKDRDYKTTLKEKYADSEKSPNLEDVLSAIPTSRFENFLFQNQRDLTFEKANSDWGMNEKINSNGAVYADLDNDGDLDMIISNLDDMASIYENNSEQSQSHWLQLVHKTNQVPSVEIRKNGQRIKKDFQRIRGYQSSVDPRIHIGLGSSEYLDTLLVFWSNETRVFTDIPANQILELSPKEGELILKEDLYPKRSFRFEYASNDTKIVYKHEENDFKDYENDVLLPHSMTRFGPMVGTGDFNSDGKEDFFVGGASGAAGRFFLQDEKGQFSRLKLKGLEEDDPLEDLASIVYDFDSDGDDDFLIVSGGEESPMPLRYYKNDPRGLIKDPTVFPKPIKVSGMTMKLGDLNSDGRMEVYIGGRWSPGAYPLTPDSYILEFRDGKFIDITEEWCPEFRKCGMVTDIELKDINGDGKEDLIAVGEWMAPKIFINEGSLLASDEAPSIPEKMEGWYFSCLVEDFNSDGLPDIALGNLGLNNKFHPSEEHPLEVYGGDADNNGTHDIILAKYEEETLYPVRGKECSSQQMPFINEKFETFESYAKSDLKKIYTEEILNTLFHLSAYQFSSGVLYNRGDHFDFIPFSNEVQIAPVMDMISLDINGDGSSEIVYAGNMYDVEVETTRYDAGNGGVLVYAGNEEFEVLGPEKTGFYAPGNVRDLQIVKNIKNETYLLVTNNNGYIYVYRLIQF